MLQQYKFNFTPYGSDTDILVFPLNVEYLIGELHALCISHKQWDELGIQTRQWHNKYGLALDMIFPTTKYSRHCLHHSPTDDILFRAVAQSTREFCDSNGLEPVLAT